MRKKIMATILGTAMLLTAVSFTGCGKSVKDSTSAKTEKTTKETKRDEKIEIKIRSKYDQIKKLLSKYPNLTKTNCDPISDERRFFTPLKTVYLEQLGYTLGFEY